MRQALARNIGPRGKNIPQAQGRDVFLPAPTGGWDTETPMAELPQTRARTMDNWIPHGVSLEMRQGHNAHVTGLVSPVETLLPYNAGATAALFAAAGTAIYNVSSPGAVGAAVVSSLTSARFSHTNITTSGGSFLWICNGADYPHHWNGTTWATPALTITTYTDNDINYVAEFKERLFFIFKNTLTFGYLPIQSIAGTVTNFPMGAVFGYGGRLVALGSLSRDGGAGLDDYFVALSSEGEIAVYQGSNPADAAEWALVGRWYAGEPIGDRPFVQMGGDLGIITSNGLVSVQSLMSSGQSPESIPYVSAPISTPFRLAVNLGRSYLGWEGIFISADSEDLLMINAPTNTTTARQFIRHRTTGGWGRFTGWNFETFEVFGGDVYAGGSDGSVYHCFNGYDDNGADITAALETAWTTMNFPGLKTLLEIRPVLTTTTRATMRVVGRTDFRSLPSLPAWPFSTITNACIWGVSLYGEKYYGGEDNTTRQWRAISGEGHNVSLALEARSNQSQFSLNGFNLRFVPGGQV